MAEWSLNDRQMARNPLGWLRAFLRRWGLENFAKRYYSVYPGVVVANEDPDGLYRVRATCPAVGMDDPATVPEDWWAWPSGMGADADGGTSGQFWVPDVGMPVWIEFEHGDPAHPKYTGLVPNDRMVAPEFTPGHLRRGFRTKAGHFLRFSDDAGDLHITLAKGDGAGSQTASFLTLDKDGNVTIANDKGSLVYLNAADDQVSVIAAYEEGGVTQTGSLLMLGNDEITLATASGGTIGIKGKDVTINGGNLILNGTLVHLASKQVYLGKNATEPAVRGNKLLVNLATQVHTCAAPGAPTTPPTTPPLILGNELSTAVFIE